MLFEKIVEKLFARGKVMLCREVTAGKDFTVQDTEDLVELCHKYGCEIYLQKPAVKVSAKSLMGVISFGLKKGTAVTVAAVGEREEEAIGRVASFVAD